MAIDRQGDISIIELKRDKTPRDIVAQVLDYASWVRRLSYSELDSIATDYKGKTLASIFSDCFNDAIPENINTNHKMLIVASELDDSTERIVGYLSDEHQVNINAIFFNFFADDYGEILGRAWLMDPEEVQDLAESRKQAPWSGYWFVNVGEGIHRNWDDNVKYGYIGAGQGAWYSGALKKLNPGCEIFAYMKGIGYVGYGVVKESACMIKDFIVDSEGKNLLDLPLSAPKATENKDDPENSEWAVKVDWKKTFPKAEAKSFQGIFANQNIVCKLRHPQTVEFLKDQFGVDR